MSDLTTFRDHCRAMQATDHKPECGALIEARWGQHQYVRPNPACPGCNSAADRELFARLADEVDAYLATDDGPGLFEGVGG